MRRDMRIFGGKYSSVDYENCRLITHFSLFSAMYILFGLILDGVQIEYST